MSHRYTPTFFRTRYRCYAWSAFPLGANGTTPLPIWGYTAAPRWGHAPHAATVRHAHSRLARHEAGARRRGSATRRGGRLAGIAHAGRKGQRATRLTRPIARHDAQAVTVTRLTRRANLTRSRLTPQPTRPRSPRRQLAPHLTSSCRSHLRAPAPHAPQQPSRLASPSPPSLPRR